MIVERALSRRLRHPHVYAVVDRAMVLGINPSTSYEEHNHKPMSVGLSLSQRPIDGRSMLNGRTMTEMEDPQYNVKKISKHSNFGIISSDRATLQYEFTCSRQDDANE